MKNGKPAIAAGDFKLHVICQLCGCRSSSQRQKANKKSVESVLMRTNLGSLEEQLAQKADEMGAKSFRITPGPSEYPPWNSSNL